MNAFLGTIDCRPYSVSGTFSFPSILEDLIERSFTFCNANVDTYITKTIVVMKKLTGYGS